MVDFHFPLQAAEALLFLNGKRTPLSDEHLHNVAAYSTVVAVDGAWNDLCDSPLAAAIDVVVGDGDSLHTPPSNWLQAVDPNFTDFEKTLRYLLTQNVKTVDIFWGSGGEMDHFLGNLSVAAKYDERIQCRFFDERQVYAYVCERAIIGNAQKATVSIYPFPKALVSSQGLAYEMHDFMMKPYGQQSLRNQIIRENVEISLHGNAFIFIQRANTIEKNT